VGKKRLVCFDVKVFKNGKFDLQFLMILNTFSPMIFDTMLGHARFPSQLVKQIFSFFNLFY